MVHSEIYNTDRAPTKTSFLRVLIMTPTSTDRTNNATFITGHPRSGTNFMMRLLDGADGLATPPGVGKLHILRRGLNLHWYADSNWSNFYGAKAVEVARNSLPYQDFFQKVDKNTKRNPLYCSRESVVPVIEAVFDYHQSQTDRQSYRWLEKNHNLEFFINRALRSFTNPKFITVRRDPRSVWASWKKYCQKTGLSLGPEQLKKNLAYLLKQEISEHFSGFQRFNSLKTLLDFYCVPREMHLQALDISITPTGEAYKHDAQKLESLIDISNLKGANSYVGSFCWHYNYLCYRADWAQDAYPETVFKVNYEDLVRETEKSVKDVCRFLRIRPPENTELPTEFDLPWHSNSSFTPGHSGVQSSSCDRWSIELSSNEADVIEEISGAF